MWHGLAIVLVDDPTGRTGDRYSAHPGPAPGLLDRLFAVALEIPGGIPRGNADCVASHGVGVLRVAGPRIAESVGEGLASDDRTYLGVHLRRTCHRVHPL